ncbi:MAG: aspartate dehydrogenase domain-containing protein [Thermodesulfobacteriota bacterium]
MMPDKSTKRIGIIGYGQIGSSIYEQIQQSPELNLEVVFIYEADQQKKKLMPAEVALESMDHAADFKPDLVVEAAHPKAVGRFAETVLQQTDLMIMSVSALADADLEEKIRSTCRKHGTHLYIPHGATLGLDGLKDGISIWEEVTITMKKNPKNLNFDAVPDKCAQDISAQTVLYDGPTRGVLPLYPKNVNSHATLAMATLGMDRTRSVLVADPALDLSVIEIDAFGAGTRIHIERSNPIKGVTGKLTILSVMESIKNIFGGREIIRIC